MVKSKQNNVAINVNVGNTLAQSYEPVTVLKALVKYCTACGVYMCVKAWGRAMINAVCKITENVRYCASCRVYMHGRFGAEYDQYLCIITENE